MTSLADGIRAQRDQANDWLDQLEAAAGFGPLADVAADLRARGLDSDHETRLRKKRVDRLRYMLLEESEWRHQVVGETQERLDAAQANLDAYRTAIQAVLDEHQPCEPPRQLLCNGCRRMRPCPTEQAIGAALGIKGDGHG